MKAVLFAMILAVGLVGGPAAAAFGGYETAYVQVQAQKGRQGAERGGERARESREDRREERRDRMTEDERKALHRDLDKANRELYGKRPQK